MTRRFCDAVQAFSSIFVFITRAKRYQTKSYQFSNVSLLFSPLCMLTYIMHFQITKKSDQIAGLLCMCIALYPHRIGESVKTSLKDKFGDKANRMQRGYIFAKN